ncbi:MAG: hypothetical protein P4L96_13665 [Rhodoferax sp.]|nr:hypothetical protein [Rhodoferax sp.]
MSFDAYKIAVKISLITNAASVLGLMSQGLVKTDKEAKGLQKSLGLIGPAMAGIGIAGLALFDKMIKPAENYTSQLVKMNMAGMKQAEIAEAVGDAWKLAGQNMTTTATGNLKALLDLRNVTGNMEEARHFLPIMQRMQTVLSASKDGGVGGKADDLAFGAMKALDIRGAINDPAKLGAQADLMTRVIIGTQGRVTPQMFQSVFNYARQAKFAMSDDFAYKILPTLMLENANKGGGGGSRGVGPQMAALYRFTNQGFVNKKALPLLGALGLLTGGTIGTTTSGTTTGPLKDAGLSASNSFEWFNKVVDDRILPYLKKNHQEATDANVLNVINMMTRGNQLAGSILGEYFMKRKNFERDRKLFEGVMSPEDAYKTAMTKDPATARRALSASWENFETSLMMNVAPLVVPALNSLATGLNVLGDWARKYPDLTKSLIISFGALSAAMAIGGTLATVTLGMKVMSAALGETAGAGLTGILGKAAAVIGGVGVAGSFGYAIGSLIYQLTEGTPLMMDFGRDVARVMAFFGSKDAKEALRLNGDAPGSTVRPAASAAASSRPVQLVLRDGGRVLADVVSTNQARSIFGVSSSGSFDLGIAQPPVNLRTN